MCGLPSFLKYAVMLWLHAHIWKGNGQIGHSCVKGSKPWPETHVLLSSQGALWPLWPQGLTKSPSGVWFPGHRVAVLPTEGSQTGLRGRCHSDRLSVCQWLWWKVAQGASCAFWVWLPSSKVAGGSLPLSGPRVPICTVSSLSQLSMLENVHDHETLMPPDLPVWEQLSGNQERGTGGRVVVGRAVPKGEVGRPVVPWHDSEQVAGRQKVSY